MEPDEVDLRQGLDATQLRAFDAAMDGKNVLITGGAGAGKTLTCERIRRGLEKKYGDRFLTKVAIAASTGTAAVLCEGTTLHSLVGPRQLKCVGDFVLKGRSKKVWRSLEVLLLDEASMISGEFFDRLSDQVELTRETPGPFGGIQLVIVMDPLQLPPISAPVQNVLGEVTREQLDAQLLEEQNRVVLRQELYPEKSEADREAVLCRGYLF